MRQLITRVDEALAEAVKERAATTGESVNAYVTRVLSHAVGGRVTWKSDAIAGGLLISRGVQRPPERDAAVSTPANYASTLVSSDREER